MKLIYNISIVDEGHERIIVERIEYRITFIKELIFYYCALSIRKRSVL